jgi:hypothetical protein
VLDKVVEYFHYWYQYRDSDDVPDMDIPVEICLELLAAADYLGLDQYVAALYRRNSHQPADQTQSHSEHEAMVVKRVLPTRS